MKNNPFSFHITLGPITKVRTHKQSSKQANNLFLQDSSLRERELTSDLSSSTLITLRSTLIKLFFFIKTGSLCKTTDPQKNLKN
jgi:hypothetical protein